MCVCVWRRGGTAHIFIVFVVWLRVFFGRAPGFGVGFVVVADDVLHSDFLTGLLDLFALLALFSLLERDCGRVGSGVSVFFSKHDPKALLVGFHARYLRLEIGAVWRREEDATIDGAGGGRVGFRPLNWVHHFGKECEEADIERGVGTVID